MAIISEAQSALRSAPSDRYLSRGSKYIQIGTEPPIEAGRSRHSPTDRRRISVRWLCGTILTGVAGASVIGAALFAALDREANFALAPQTAEVVQVDDATDEMVNPDKSDRLVKAVDIVAAKQSFRTPTTIKVGDKEVVKVHSFTHVSTTLALTNTSFGGQVPAFNPLSLLDDTQSPAQPVVEAAPVLDDAEASFAIRDLTEAPARFTLSADEVQAEVQEEMTRAASAGEHAPSPIAPQLLLKQARITPGPTGEGPSDAAAAQTFVVSSSLAPSVRVRMVPENVTVVRMSDPAPPQAQTTERLIVLRQGDTLEDVLRGAGATNDQIRGIVAAFNAPRGTQPVAAGKEIKLLFTDIAGTGQSTQIAKLSVYSDQTLETTIALADSGAYVLVSQTDNGKSAPRAGDDDSDANSTALRLYPSLYETALKQAVPKPIIDQLVHIFSNDVDFQRPVVAGDSFEAFYDQGEADSTDDSQNTLLYASITTHNQTYRFYRFQSPVDNTVDYYDPQGQSSRKFLLRKPLAAGVETSPFGERMHPVLGYRIMHTGVDWAAPEGTSIIATGNGTVTKVGRDGGYGNRIEIQHANGYITTYNHLSGYAKGLAEGQRVRQGQVIGFLGATGLTTGPNIHYEVIVNGNFVDPMRVKLPDAKELEGPTLAAFQRERDRIDALMAKAPNATEVATTQPNPSP